MKKSEIINFLNSRKCVVKSYYRENNHLCVYVKYLGSIDLVEIDKAGLLVFLTGNGNLILMEFAGKIEWD